MRVGFAGTPPFAVMALEAILAAGFSVPVVLTRPDRPRGRGLALQPSPVKSAALAHGLVVQHPATLKAPEAERQVTGVSIDVLVVAAYGLILPPAILEWPRHGALNIHASLLPRWRGAAPIQRALLAGDTESGITIMKMDAGLDTGPMVERIPVAIAPRETAGTLERKLAACGAEAIGRVLRTLARAGALPGTPQPEQGITYATKVERREAEIDWSADAAEVDRVVRAFHPAPGAYTAHHGELWKIWSAEPLAEAHAETPGTVLRANRDGIVIACGSGALAARVLQPAGGKRIAAEALAAGRRVRAGDRFTRAACPSE